MLWYKYWLETRGGFVLAMAVLITTAAAGVLYFPAAVRGGMHDLALHHHANAAARGFAIYVREEVFEKLALLWAMLSVMLGTGGLLKEKLLGTAPFLLSLPVGRRQAIAVRCGVSMMQCGCLALGAYGAVPAAALLVGQSYGLGLALRYAGILLAAGVAFVVYGILISTAMEGTAWPAIIGATTVFLLLIVPEAVKGIVRLAPLAVLAGESYSHGGVMPWAGMAISSVAAAAMLGLALWVVKWQDF